MFSQTKVLLKPKETSSRDGARQSALIDPASPGCANDGEKLWELGAVSRQMLGRMPRHGGECEERRHLAQSGTPQG